MVVSLLTIQNLSINTLKNYMTHSPHPETDKRIRELGPNMCSDLARMFEEKCMNLTLALATARTQLAEARRQTGIKPLEQDEILYWQQRHDEAFERLKLPEFRKK